MSVLGVFKHIAALAVYSVLIGLAKANKPEQARGRTAAVVFTGALGDFFVMSSAAKALYESGFSLTLICRDGFETADAAALTGFFDETVTLKKGLLNRLGNIRRLKKVSVETVFPAPLGRHPLSDIYTLSVSAARHILPDTDMDVMSEGIRRRAEKKADSVIPIGSMYEADRYEELLNKSGLCAARLQPLSLCDERTERINTVVLFPGASRAEKQLPLEKWAEVLLALREKTDCRIVIMGNGSDMAACRKTEALLRGLDVKNLCGRFSVSEAMKFLSKCRLVLANDSGGAHMGLVSGTPVVVVCGMWQYGRFFPGCTEGRRAASVFSGYKGACCPCKKSIPDCTGSRSPAACLIGADGREILERALELMRG